MKKENPFFKVRGAYIIYTPGRCLSVCGSINSTHSVQCRAETRSMTQGRLGLLNHHSRCKATNSCQATLSLSQQEPESNRTLVILSTNASGWCLDGQIIYDRLQRAGHVKINPSVSQRPCVSQINAQSFHSCITVIR